MNEHSIEDVAGDFDRTLRAMLYAAGQAGERMARTMREKFAHEASLSREAERKFNEQIREANRAAEQAGRDAKRELEQAQRDATRAAEMAARDASLTAQREADRLAREAANQLREERDAARLLYRPAANKSWWDRAEPTEIAKAWQTAAGWSEQDPQARTVMEFMSEEISRRYGVKPDEYMSDATRLRLTLGQGAHAEDTKDVKGGLFPTKVPDGASKDAVAARDAAAPGFPTALNPVGVAGKVKAPAKAPTRTREQTRGAERGR